MVYKEGRAVQNSSMESTYRPKPTILDWSQVKSSVESFQKSLSLDSPNKAFPYFAVSKILKIDDDETRAAITDGGDDRGIDAVYIDSRPDRRIFHFFNSSMSTPTKR